MASHSATGRSLRVALYSHDTQGLGHIRRNLAIAAALMQAFPDASILLITGTRVAGAMDAPAGVDMIALPALAKDVKGRYASRSLQISLASILNVRSQLLVAALASFQPDAFIVDKVALGALGELERALRMLRDQGRTCCILGLRDILDTPSVVRRDWLQGRSEEAIAAFYHAVWVYGDPRVFDATQQYGFSSSVVEKLRFVGYLNRFQVEPVARDVQPDQPIVLCQVGGGQDGFHLAHAFVQAHLPEHLRGVLLTGPLMPGDQRSMLDALAAKRTNMTILDFHPHPERLLPQAERVIAMGGYNTTCEILASRRPALLVPRVRPRLEQWIRAEHLHRLGLVDVLHPEAATPEALSEWLASPLEPPRVYPVDLNGLQRLPGLLRQALGARRPHPAPVLSQLPVFPATGSLEEPYDTAPFAARGVPAQNVSALL